MDQEAYTSFKRHGNKLFGEDMRYVDSEKVCDIANEPNRRKVIQSLGSEEANIALGKIC